MSGVQEFLDDAGSAHKVVVEKTRQLAGKWEKSGLLEGLAGQEQRGIVTGKHNSTKHQRKQVWTKHK